jgi:hypothetical protein
VFCLDMYAYKLFISLLDGFVVYSKISINKLQGWYSSLKWSYKVKNTDFITSLSSLVLWGTEKWNIVSTKTWNGKVRKIFKFPKKWVLVPRLVFLKFQGFLLAFPILAYVFFCALACIHYLCVALIYMLRSYWLVCLIGL